MHPEISKQIKRLWPNDLQDAFWQFYEGLGDERSRLFAGYELADWDEEYVRPWLRLFNHKDLPGFCGRMIERLCLNHLGESELEETPVRISRHKLQEILPEIGEWEDIVAMW